MHSFSASCTNVDFSEAHHVLLWSSLKSRRTRKHELHLCCLCYTCLHEGQREIRGTWFSPIWSKHKNFSFHGMKLGKNESYDEFVDLPSIVKTVVLEESMLDLFDVDILRGWRSLVDDGLLRALQLAMGCCAPSPSVRLDIKVVIQQLEEIRPKTHSALYTPTDWGSSLKTLDTKSKRRVLTK